MNKSALKTLATVGVASLAVCFSGPAMASSEGGHHKIERQQWSFAGVRGRYD